MKLAPEEIANFLALKWANRHINGITWAELLDLHLALEFEAKGVYQREDDDS